MAYLGLWLASSRWREVNLIGSIWSQLKNTERCLLYGSLHAGGAVLWDRWVLRPLAMLFLILSNRKKLERVTSASRQDLLHLNLFKPKLKLLKTTNIKEVKKTLKSCLCFVFRLTPMLVLTVHCQFYLEFYNVVSTGEIHQNVL